MGEELRDRGMWYIMKYDIKDLLSFGKDVDVMKLLKGNDEHAYIYVDGEEGAVFRRVHESASVGGDVCGGTSGAWIGKRTVGNDRSAEGEVAGGIIGRGGGTRTGDRYDLCV